MLVTTEGIVLRQRKISNNRRMIVLFTRRYGKITAGTSINERGKGKSALALRPFAYAEYDIFKNRGFYNINGADVRESYYAIGEDIDRFLVASKLIEYLDRILEEEQPRTRLFDLTIEFLQSITRANSNFDTLLYAFIVKSLGMQGVMPELKICVNCGKELQAVRTEAGGKVPFFSVPDGGILCKECATGNEQRDKRAPRRLIFKPEFDIVDVLQYFVNKPLSVFEKVALKPQVAEQIRRILSEYLQYYMDAKVLEEEIHF